MIGVKPVAESLVSLSRAEMKLFENEAPVEIAAVAQWHPAIGFSEGLLRNWTFDAGGVIDILSFADYSGTVANAIKVTTDGAHGYTAGDPVGLVGPDIEIGDADPYAGIYQVEGIIDADEYYIINPNWNSTSTAESILPSRLIAGPGSDGGYEFSANASISTVANSKNFDFRLFQNITPSDKSQSRFSTKSGGDWGSASGGSLTEIIEGDTIWFAIKGVTDDTNIIIRNSNVKMTRG